MFILYVSFCCIWCKSVVYLVHITWLSLSQKLTVSLNELSLATACLFYILCTYFVRKVPRMGSVIYYAPLIRISSIWVYFSVRVVHLMANKVLYQHLNLTTSCTCSIMNEWNWPVLERCQYLIRSRLLQIFISQY
jgi:hypothetical protein